MDLARKHDLRSRHAGFGIKPSRGKIRCLQVILPTAAVCAISIDAAEQPERRRMPALGRKSFSGWSGSQQADKNLALIKPGPTWKGPRSPSAASSLTADAATHSLRHDRRLVCAALPPVGPCAEVRCGMACYTGRGDGQRCRSQVEAIEPDAR
jgi:hypothetical protein